MTESPVVLVPSQALRPCRQCLWHPARAVRRQDVTKKGDMGLCVTGEPSAPPGVSGWRAQLSWALEKAHGCVTWRPEGTGAAQQVSDRSHCPLPSPPGRARREKAVQLKEASQRDQKHWPVTRDSSGLPGRDPRSTPSGRPPHFLTQAGTRVPREPAKALQSRFSSCSLPRKDTFSF